MLQSMGLQRSGCSRAHCLAGASLLLDAGYLLTVAPAAAPALRSHHSSLMTILIQSTVDIYLSCRCPRQASCYVPLLIKPCTYQSGVVLLPLSSVSSLLSMGGASFRFHLRKLPRLKTNTTIITSIRNLNEKVYVF